MIFRRKKISLPNNPNQLLELFVVAGSRSVAGVEAVAELLATELVKIDDIFSTEDVIFKRLAAISASQSIVHEGIIVVFDS